MKMFAYMSDVISSSMVIQSAFLMSGSEKKAEDSKLLASCWGPMNSYVSPNHWVMMFGCYISSNGIETNIVSSFCG